LAHRRTVVQQVVLATVALKSIAIAEAPVARADLARPRVAGNCRQSQEVEYAPSISSPANGMSLASSGSGASFRPFGRRGSQVEKATSWRL
ncbi:MAG: hypothetical protein ACREQQ_12050, partial [Candidatus Binatia bacterium]